MTDIPADRLVAAARRALPANRSALAGAIGELYGKAGHPLSEREKELAYDILSTLIRDVETHVRVKLATNLAAQPDAPRDLILTLANDVIDVARPVIVHSVVLQDEDLIRMILKHAEAHQVAVAGRSRLATRVTDHLVKTENNTVIKATLVNDGAEFSEATLEDVVNLSRSDPSLQESLVTRKDLSESQARSMYQFVGAELQRALKQRRDSTTGDQRLDMEQIIREAVEDALDEDDFLPPAPAANKNKPSPDLLVAALEERHLFRFEELFQQLTELSERATARVLYDFGPEAIAIACKACAFDRHNFGTVMAHLQGSGAPEEYRQSPDYFKLLDYFDRIDRQGARRVLTAWRDAPETR